MTIGEWLRRVNLDDYINSPPQELILTWDGNTGMWQCSFRYGNLHPHCCVLGSRDPSEAVRLFVSRLKGHVLARLNTYHSSGREYPIDEDITCDDALGDEGEP